MQRTQLSLVRFLMLVTFLSSWGRVAALDAGLVRLNHRAFTPAEGTPQNIVAITQTPDGTLWIGGSVGLMRFDGARFVPYPGASEDALPATYVHLLTSAPEGGVWIGYNTGGVSFLKDGHVRSYPPGTDFPKGSVHQFSWDRDGSLWATAGAGLAHFNGVRWEKIDLECDYVCWGVLVDRRGTVWVATSHVILARLAGERRFREVAQVEFGSDTAAAPLVEAPDGKIWAAGHRIMRIDRPATLEGPTLITLSGYPGNAAGPLLLDREGNLWTSPWNLAGIESTFLRVPAQELTLDGKPELMVTPEILSSANGQPTGATVFFQDREGNVWTGSETGLHRFSNSNVAVEHLPCIKPALAAGEGGALWLACRDEPSTVSQIRDGAIVNQQKTPTFTAAYRDTQGTVWFAGDTAVGQIKDGRLVLTPIPSQLQGGDAQALVRDASGALWISLLKAGVVRYADGKWSQPIEALKRFATVEVADNDGSLWFGYTRSSVLHLSNGAVHSFDAAQGLKVGTVQGILAEDGDIWVGGDIGLAHFDHGRFVMISNETGRPFRGISGIIRTHTGDLWLNTIEGVQHISHDEIQRLSRDSGSAVRSSNFNYLDGAGPAVQIRPLPTAIEAADGRLWFLVSGGVVSIDPSHVVRNALAPPVRIWSLTAGNNRIVDLKTEIQLPVNTANLQIDYSAGSLTVPERVQFRYKLEGSDQDWQEVGARRVALYTNLGPGHYSFHVIACNNDGVWNTEGASLKFLIPPAFYQTRWFDALCAIAAVLLLAVLYRVRLRQVASQVRSRLEARLAERERIARELHDTLLQGMQGLIWRFQAAADRIPPDQPARQLMEQSLDRADKLLEESRDKVKDLRPAGSGTLNLEQALAREGEHLAQDQSTNFRVNVQGTPRDLHPIVREEGLLIAREALGNAFRHAEAKDIEVELTYGESAFHLRVRDDGRGIDATVLAGGRPGHFGLTGMRERAKKLGAHLDVWSKPNAGSEIDLRIPADVAYREMGRDSSRLRRFFVHLRARGSSE
jgi:signal transduction histidine kinase/ligand-binding sensor domain-containing protein